MPAPRAPEPKMTFVPPPEGWTPDQWSEEQKVAVGSAIARMILRRREAKRAAAQSQAKADTA